MSKTIHFNIIYINKLETTYMPMKKKWLIITATAELKMVKALKIMFSKYNDILSFIISSII